MKCQCQKELTETDVCPLPSGRICVGQPCPPESWEQVEEEEDDMPEYREFPDSAYDIEARALQIRVEVRRRKGTVVTSDELWAWIKARKPLWTELDWEKVFQRVKL